MMTVEDNRVGWRFWLWWVLASTVGWLLGFLVGFIGGHAVEEILPSYGNAAIGAGLGAGVGIMQWLILRRQVSRAGWWVLASTVGWGVSVAVWEGVAALGRAMGFFPFAVALVGGGVGLGAITGIMLIWLLRQPAPEA